MLVLHYLIIHERDRLFGTALCMYRSAQRLPVRQQVKVLWEDELDRTTVVRLLKSVSFYEGNISEALQQALAEHIQVAALDVFCSFKNPSQKTRHACFVAALLFLYLVDAMFCVVEV